MIDILQGSIEIQNDKTEDTDIIPSPRNSFVHRNQTVSVQKQQTPHGAREWQLFVSDMSYLYRYTERHILPV